MGALPSCGVNGSTGAIACSASSLSATVLGQKGSGASRPSPEESQITTAQLFSALVSWGICVSYVCIPGPSNSACTFLLLKQYVIFESSTPPAPCARTPEWKKRK